MSTTARRAALLSAPLLAVAVLAGCGSPSTPAASGAATTSASTASASPIAKPSVSELFAQTKAAALAAKSGRATGEWSASGQTMKIDLTGDAAGTNQKVAMGGDASGTAEVLTVAGTTYVKGNEAFWKQKGIADSAESAAVGLLADRYVALSAKQATPLADITLGKLLRGMFTKAEKGSIHKVKMAVKDTTFQGQPAYSMTAGASASEVIVSADGKARLLQIKGTAKEPGQMTFSDWDAVKPFEAPAASEVTKLS